MSLLVFILSCVLFIVSSNEAARILAVLPFPSISHQVVFRPLTQELAKRGHEVVVITPDPAFPKGEALSNLTEIDVHDISYKIWRDKFLETSKGNKNDLVKQLEIIFNVMIDFLDAQLSDEQVQNMIRDKKKKFDLLLIEACVRPALIFSHIYKVPVIQVSSFGATIDNYEVIGAPVHAFLYPAYSRQRLNNLTLWEKATEFYNIFLFGRMYEHLKTLEHNMLKKHIGDHTPSIDELNNNVHMLFLNVHPVFSGIRPVPPTVIFTSGIHQMPVKQLPTVSNT